MKRLNVKNLCGDEIFLIPEDGMIRVQYASSKQLDSFDIIDPRVYNRDNKIVVVEEFDDSESEYSFVLKPDTDDMLLLQNMAREDSSAYMSDKTAEKTRELCNELGISYG